jgi:hypothetical protein
MDPLIQASIKEKICTEMEAGTPWSLACDLAGVNRTSAWEWRGKDPEFRKRIAAIQSPNIRQAKKTLEDALTTGPIESRARVAMWLLERQDPMNYAPVAAIESAVAEALGKDADYNGILAELDSSDAETSQEERV